MWEAVFVLSVLNGVFGVSQWRHWDGGGGRGEAGRRLQEAPRLTMRRTTRLLAAPDRALLLLLACASNAAAAAAAACIDVVAGGGAGESPAAAAAAAIAATGTAFPFTALAARPNSSDIAVAGRGAVYLRLAASGDVVRVAGTAASTLQAVTSVDDGLGGRPGALTPLCGEGDCVGGLSYSPLDGTLVLVSGGFVRALGPDGLLRVVAFGGARGTAGDGGPATTAQALSPSFTAVSPADGSVLVSDYRAHTVRRVRPDGVIVLFAGTPGIAGDSGDGGPATNARLNAPLGLAFAVSPGGGLVLFVAEYAGRVRRVEVASGLISTFAGTGASPAGHGAGDGGAAALAQLGVPVALAVDPVAGALFIADLESNVVRRVRLADGIIDTVAGDGGGVSATSHCTTDAGGCPATSVSIAQPKGLAVNAGGDLFILTENSVVVHIVTFAARSASAPGSLIVFDTVQGSQVAAVVADARDATLQGPGNLEELSDGSVVIVEYSGQRVRRLMPDGSLVLLAGGAARTAVGAFVDGSPLSALALRAPYGVVAITPGTSFGRAWPALSFALSDESANLVYGVAGATPSAQVFRLAGAADRHRGGADGDGGPARNATLSQPRGLELDVDGGLILVDAGNGRVRKISAGNAPTISTIAGGGSDASDGVPATSAQFFSMFGACRNAAGLIFVPDLGTCSLRVVDLTTGLISTASGAGAGAVNGCGFAGDGGAASAAKLSVPVGCSRDSDGGLLIADSANSRVRKISAGALSSATISTLVGGGGGGGSGGGGGGSGGGGALPPLQAQLDFPTNVRRSASGDLLIGDFGAGIVRRVLREGGARPQPCPAGFFCACLATAPCSNPAFFCTERSTAPLPVSAGYRAVAAAAAAAAPAAAGGPAAPPASSVGDVSQEVCPLGYCCVGASEASACPPGTFGVGTGQVSADACRPCSAGSYFAGEAGAAQLASPATSSALVPPCLQCPRGSFGARAGSARCSPCPPGTTTLQAGAQQPSQCVVCSPRSISLFGSACVREGGGGGKDVLVVSGSRLQLQRLVDLNSVAGDLDGPTQFDIVIKLCAFAIAAGLALALLAALQPVLPRRAASALEPALRSLDIVSSSSNCSSKKGANALLRAAAASSSTRRIFIAGAAMQRGSEEAASSDERPENDEHEREVAGDGGGKSPPPQKQHTRLGVVLSAAVLVAIACVAFATSTQFFAVNVDVTSALQPSSPSDIDAYASAFSPFELAQEPAPNGGGADDVSLPEALGGLSSGLLVSVRASGSRCGQVYGEVASDLSRGAFTHAVSQDAASGEARHSFACAACVPHDLSTLRFSLARECEASAVLTVSAVGAWGSVTATSQLVGGAALGGGVSLTVPVTLEVLQDLSWSDYASALQASGVLAAGGKSKRGLGVGAAQGLAQTAPPAGAADPQAALPPAEPTVDFTLNLPLQPSFVLATLSLRTSWPGCASDKAARLGRAEPHRPPPLPASQTCLTLSASRGSCLWAALPT